MPDDHTDDNGQITLRLVGVIFALLGCTFLWIALLTYHPFDPPSLAAWPANNPPCNGCGMFGAFIAFYLVRYLGAGAYTLALFLSLAAGARLLRGQLGEWPLRLGGLLLLVSVTCGAATMLTVDPLTGRLTEAGGILGIAIVHILTTHLSKAGTALIFLATLVVGMLLTADELVIRCVQALRWLGQNGRTAWATVAAGPATGRSRVSRQRSTPTLGARIGHYLRSGLTAAIGSLVRIEPKPTAEKRKSRRTGESQPPPAPGTPDSKIADAPSNSPTTDPAVPADRAPGESTAPAPDPISPVVPEEAATGPVQADAAALPASDSVESSLTESAPANADPAPAAPAEPQPQRSQPIVRTLGSRHTGDKPPPSPWPKELGDYVLPPVELLDEPEYSYIAAQESVVREKGQLLEQTLQEFRIDARVVEIDTGPVITMFELSLAPGIKVSQIASLSNDIARALKAPAIRVVAPIPGKDTVGIEVPNTDKEKVRLKELITLSGVKPTKMALPLFLGKDASGNPLIADLAVMPHMLIAGTTGSGKSVCINTLVMSVLMTQRPDHVKLVLIDPKMVEMSVFKDIPHLMCPIVTDMNKAEMILEWAATKMDERYELLAEAGVRHVAHFNRLGKDEIYNRFNPSNEEERAQIPTHLPYIVIIIDELADLMMTSGKAVEHHLCRIAQKSRAVGIHIILATQRPQANVVTGLIKSNLPCRVAFRVASRMDSRIVLDQNGAEVLMGQGDMLFLPPGTSKLVRSQGTFIEDDELKRVLDDLRSKAQPEFHHELVKMRPTGEGGETERDPLFDDAVAIVIETKRGSVSLLQRRLAIGYTRASRLIDQMCFAGIVGEHKGSQQREVLVTADDWAAIKSQRDREIDHGNYEADQDTPPDDVESDPESA